LELQCALLDIQEQAADVLEARAGTGQRFLCITGAASDGKELDGFELIGETNDTAHAGRACGAVDETGRLSQVARRQRRDCGREMIGGFGRPQLHKIVKAESGFSGQLRQLVPRDLDVRFLHVSSSGCNSI
jgi:hypothetical protein